MGYKSVKKLHYFPGKRLVKVKNEKKEIKKRKKLVKNCKVE